MNGERGTLKVAAGDGTGSFGPQVVVATDLGQFDALALGDVDADGDLDNALGPVLQILPNDGTGSFSGPVLAYPGAALTVAGLLAGDLDGDGRDDLIVKSSAAAEVAVARATATGFAPLRRYPSGAETTSLDAVVDIDGDGDLDVVNSASGRVGVPFPTAGRVEVLLGDGQGSLAAPRSTWLPPLEDLVVAELNGDGRSDLYMRAIADSGSNIFG